VKIAFLHFTMGLVNRGSEISTDIIATALGKQHQVTVFQSGPLISKVYKTICIHPLVQAPTPAPTNIITKLLSRLYLDNASITAKKFTQQCIPELQKLKPDIIIATNGLPQLKVLKKANLNAKIVVFGRAGIGYHDKDSLKARPDLFVALTPQAKLWANTIAKPTTKVVYIPNPVMKVEAKAIDLNLPRPIVLTVGALSRYKNIPAVIKAVSKLQASLVLIGDGEESAHVQSALSHFPGDFRWLKHVDPTEISSYYASSDIFCFVPDPQEAFGRVYLEAMAVGLPIVASNDPIRRGIVGAKGHYADPHNLDSVVSALQTASTTGRVDYTKDLMPYQPKTVVAQIEKEINALIN